MYVTIRHRLHKSNMQTTLSAVFLDSAPTVRFGGWLFSSGQKLVSVVTVALVCCEVLAYTGAIALVDTVANARTVRTVFMM